MPYVVVVPESYIGTKHTSLEDFLNLLALATACYVLDLRPCKVVRPAKGTATRNERLMAWRLFQCICDVRGAHIGSGTANGRAMHRL
jgi:hypothetical protein